MKSTQLPMRRKPKHWHCLMPQPAQLGAAIGTDARNTLAALKAIGPKTRAAWFKLVDKIRDDIVEYVAPRGALNTLDDVAAQMRANLPPGMNPKQFGEVMKWGGGSNAARQRIATLTADELRRAGVTAEMAENWAAAYDAVVRISPKNPSAAGRADLMRQAARLLRGE